MTRLRQFRSVPVHVALCVVLVLGCRRVGVGRFAVLSPREEARASEWRRRAAAAHDLAREYETGDPELDRLLHSLLLDREDTAVTVPAAQALLLRGTSDAARLVFKAVAEADDDTIQDLGDEIVFASSRTPAVEQWARAALTDEDGQVREGAAEVLSWL